MAGHIVKRPRRDGATIRQDREMRGQGFSHACAQGGVPGMYLLVAGGREKA